jgi:hypothetical protein
MPQEAFSPMGMLSISFAQTFHEIAWHGAFLRLQKFTRLALNVAYFVEMLRMHFYRGFGITSLQSNL